MIPLQAMVIALTAVAGLAVVLTRDLVRLALMTSVFGLVLVVLFLVLQAPDVALSELAVGAVGFPVVIAVAIAIDRAK